MAELSYTKSHTMRLVERAHGGKSIDRLVREAVRKHDTPEEACAWLGVSRTTLAKWRRMFVDQPGEAGVA